MLAGAGTAGCTALLIRFPLAVFDFFGVPVCYLNTGGKPPKCRLSGR